MRDNLKKITIKGASGWGPVDLAYDDKLHCILTTLLL